MNALTADQAWELERALADALSDRGWEVETEPVLGTVQPDLIATGPSGETLVAEVKASEEPVHFATIAQVAKYGGLARDTRGLDRVRPFLLTLGSVSEAARQAADELGVIVLTSESVGGDTVAPGERLRDVASLWAARLATHS